MHTNDNPQLSIAQSSGAIIKTSLTTGPCADNFKRQRPNIDKSTQELTCSDVTESPGSSFKLDAILRSTNVEFSQSPLDPSPPELKDPYDDDLFDDLELDQYLESLTGPVSIEHSGPSLSLDDTDEFDLKQSDEDALDELLKQDT
ncbi:hypothetical protein FGSG_08547 [Fusarium graminearum PH-1]|nr:hypothetical protein FGSG_08547 [Fusarium graminearum PH-1]ESU14783.1 hypothetical protein FGSG_08547 [Fusarium graminearum PH-1]|eukprot:XP_011320208.1 hypothetical protein FGSG_08547 [Fusarium graminearum PH-1]